ncbi:hypothetical protein HNR65_000307 [Desulfosalsimonas propionicica]|uniref:Sulfotransferase family protein n=1 Tax=Desulfosalsimonas propionicica TaxID=332175 RepID=A0A7W0C6L5_9BACT|nr:sulfotransferase family protein [Desulfosalsimonas propionicica]MBA2880000.1 hypothetical protein [Desulfosalsimonas propionicica]
MDLNKEILVAASSILNPVVLGSPRILTIYKTWRTLSSICVSNQHRFVFIRIPKAANTALLFNLYLSTGGKEIDFWDRRKITYEHFSHLGGKTLMKGILPLKYYTFFTVCRNPYTRILSAYLQKFAMSAFIKRFQSVKPSFLPSIDGFLSFLTFLENGGLYSDHHWIPQVDFLWPEKSRIDYLLRSESLDSDMHRLFKTLNLDTPNKYHEDIGKKIIKSGSAPTGADKKISSFYVGQSGRAAAKIVYRLYRKDFEVFGYPASIPNLNF